MAAGEQRAYSRGYGRGYYTGLRRAWPTYKPPMPPQPIVAAMMQAAINLRDHGEGWCQVFDPDDEFVEGFRLRIDDLDAAMEMLKKWLVSTDEAPKLDVEAKAP